MDSSFEYRVVCERLTDIFRKGFEMRLDSGEAGILDEKLIGPRLRFTARDLLCLYFMIEKEFDMSIPQEDVANGRFNSFNDIAGMVFGVLKGN